LQIFQGRLPRKLSFYQCFRLPPLPSSRLKSVISLT
jgi:hypothetical protein